MCKVTHVVVCVRNVACDDILGVFLQKMVSALKRFCYKLVNETDSCTSIFEKVRSIELYVDFFSNNGSNLNKNHNSNRCYHTDCTSVIFLSCLKPGIKDARLHEITEVIKAPKA